MSFGLTDREPRDLELPCQAEHRPELVSIIPMRLISRVRRGNPCNQAHTAHLHIAQEAFIDMHLPYAEGVLGITSRA
jgi:hypothetical protein